MTVTSGSSFDLRLPTSPQDGYAWCFQMTGDLLRIVEDEYEEAGELPCQRVRLEAQGPGAATLACTYAHPDGTQPTEIRTYIVRVEA